MKSKAAIEQRLPTEAQAISTIPLGLVRRAQQVKVLSMEPEIALKSTLNVGDALDEETCFQLVLS